MDFGAAKILCVEPHLAVLESRCAILKHSGYDAVSASPELAEIVLRSQNFDLIVLSNLSKSDLLKIINLADGANVLVLYESTLPSELLSLVAIGSSMCTLFFPRATTKRSWLN
jgi:DNA-binding response OmpR family regulator